MSMGHGLRCPGCSDFSLAQVVDSRLSRDGNFVRRRRKCGHCGRRCTTYEYVEAANLVVEKRDGRKEMFDEGKIIRSLRCALGKGRDPALSERIAERIKEECQTQGVLSSKTIAERVLTYLWDQREIPAYIRYGVIQNKIRHLEELRKWLFELNRKLPSSYPFRASAPR